MTYCGRALAAGLLLLWCQMAGVGCAAPAGPVHGALANRTDRVKAGIDVLSAEHFARLAGRRVGLLTNLAARTSGGQLTVDAMLDAPGLRLVALFAPEHGLSAAEDSDVASARDARTGLQVYSLYGNTPRPTAAMLRGLDIIVIDLPDIGARFYTYVTTMAYVLEEAARNKVAVMVLDRPNPITGVAVEGPWLDEDLTSFVGYVAMPVRHGMTLGELAQLVNGERAIGASLEVVEARGWRREMWFDETGLPWSNPSPNIRTLAAATLYPGIGAIEWSNISVGRGTQAPFEQVGAPWVDGRQLADDLNARTIPGIAFSAVTFTPASSVYAGQPCGGVTMVLTDRSRLRPVRVGVEIAAALLRRYPDRIDFGRTVQLLGSRATLDRIRHGDDPTTITTLWSHDEARWRALRSRYLLYR